MTRTRPPRRRLKVARFVVLSVGAVVSAAGLYFFHKLQVYREAGAIRDRAAAAATREDWPLSVSLYRNYLRLQPEDTDTLKAFAGSLEELVKTSAPGKRPELISTYERLRQFDSLTPDLRRKLAGHNLTAGYPARARESIEFLLASPDTRPDDAGLLELAAACEEQERNVPQATKYYRDAIKTGRATPEAYLHLATLLRRNPANPTAASDAEAVLADLKRDRPDDLQARLARARYWLSQDKTQAARDDIEYAYRSIPGGADNVEVVQTLTGLATARGDFAVAQEVLAKALAKNPNELRLLLSLADVQIQRRDADAARKTLLAAVQRELPLSQLTLDIADRLLDLGEPAAVTGIAAKLVQGDAAFAADYLTGRVKLAEGNWPAALPLLKSATDHGLARLPTHHAAALVSLAECYALAGDEEQRAKAVADAVRADPRSVRARLAQAEGLARAGKAGEAVALYAQLVPFAASARVSILELRAAEVLARPEAERDWRAVEEWYGPEPRAAAVNVVRASVLSQQGKTAEGLALLERAVADPDAVHAPGPSVALAYARAARDPAAGLRTLDDAEKRIGDRVDFRLARLAITLRTGAADVRQLAKLGEATGPFSAADRYRLFARLGETFAALRRPAEAIDFSRRAAAENPFDLGLRAALFQLAVQANDAALQAQTLAEIETLEGPGGPVRAVAEVTRDLRDLKPGDTARADELRARLKPAQEKRPTWPPVEVLLADLDLVAGRGDAALGHYRRALALGDASEAVVGNAVRLLLDREGQAEALGLLDRQSRRGPLSEDLTRQLVVLRSAYGQDPARSLAWARSPEGLASKDARDHLVRAGVLESNGAKDDARRAVETALSLDANSPPAWVTLVRLVAAAGKAGEAKKLAGDAAKALHPVADRPDSAAAVALALGACQELIGDLGRAEQYDREALRLAPADVGVNRQLHRLLHRAGRAADADKLYEDLARAEAATPEGRRYARRMLAYAKVNRSGAATELAAALALLDRNLAEGGDLLDDRRAKALVLATDPFRRAEAIELLNQSSQGTPLTAEESYNLGRLYAQQGRPNLAEVTLKDATRAVALALPEHLAALAKVQVTRGDATAAAATVARLRANFATSWEAVSEEARVLAFDKRPADAAKRLLDSPFAADPDTRLNRVAPFLEEIGLGADAERVYREAAKAGTPLAHTPLAGYLLRTRRAADAVELAYAHEATAPVGVTARLLAGGASVLPVALAPEAGREKWAETVRRIDEWVTAKLAANPGNPEVLFAKALIDDLNGRYSEELAVYEQLTRLAPDNDAFATNFALLLALHARDGGDRALGLVEAAIARKGYTPTLLDTRAVIHTAGGHPDKAIPDLTAAITLDPRPVYSFHLALAEEQKAGPKGATTARDAALKDAARRGLTKAMLHAKEWPDYDRLTGK